MKKKTFKGSLQVDEVGSFKAVFSTFNVVDHDRDVTLPGAFTSGQKVRISHWGHRWADLPAGKGTIEFNDTEAWVNGQFFMDTEVGQETYKTVKNLEDLQEWSYGFNVLESESGQFDGKDVNFLKALDVFEVSPVLLGAGINTRTESIKSQNDDTPYCSAENCKTPSDVFISVCQAHLSADTVTWAKALAQALDETQLEALIKELTPQEPQPKAVRLHEMIAALSEARANSRYLEG